MVLARKKVIILGCGYLGEYVARDFARRDCEVVAVRRDWPRACLEERENPHIRRLSLDLHQPDWYKTLPKEPTIVLNFLSAGGQGLEGYRRNYLESQQRIAQWLDQLSSPPEHYLFTSSSRVYPQDGGRWVGEADAPEHLSEDDAGDLLRQAEKAIFAWPEGLVEKRTVLRIAGIYGPGRNFLLRQIKAGGSFVREYCQHYLNLIRVEDIVTAITAVLDTPREESRKIYNLSDGNPSRKEEVLLWLALKTGRKTPLWAGPESSKVSFRGRAGVRTSRRIDTRKIRRETKWQPQYLDFQEGFKELI
ncbi:MAG: NAD-dependent epimerase/dehydratase family protein [Opitutales bacterium]|nr:NAD-dependent epimerase/dehydratase family protein [Opitutales bacterium]